mgnify:CR=1 FL=1
MGSSESNSDGWTEGEATVEGVSLTWSLVLEGKSEFMVYASEE